jgi:hypothetical protein
MKLAPAKSDFESPCEKDQKMQLKLLSRSLPKSFRSSRLSRSALRIGLAVVTLCLLAGVGGVAPSVGLAAGPATGLSVDVAPTPANFSAEDQRRCSEEYKCDALQLLVANTGSQATSGPIVLQDHLPAGLKPVYVETLRGGAEELEWSCHSTEGLDARWLVSCTLEESIPVGRYAGFVRIQLSAPSPDAVGPLLNEVQVSGGGTGTPAESTLSIPISSARPPFELSEFSFHPTEEAGGSSTLSAGHPWQVLAAFKVPSIFGPETVVIEHVFEPVEDVRAPSVELPLGFVGNPQAVGTCTGPQLRNNSCPKDSEVGSFAVLGDALAYGEWSYTGKPDGCCAAVYNIAPDRGYPAEFGFFYANQPVFLDASVIHTGQGYRLRITPSGVLSILETAGFSIRFFGEPGAINGISGSRAFLTNPSDCSGGPLSARIEVESWQQPLKSIEASNTAYAGITGCNQIEFQPSLQARPTTTSADSPAGLHVDLKIPQTSEFEERATPPLRDAAVTLPEGLVVNPAAADGLVSCEAAGPTGINIGSGETGVKGQDLGDPEATELGAGHAGGNGSPFDDGFYHVAPGHCPEGSTLGSVEAITPLLEEPIHGRVYLATPECAPCSSVDAQGGKLLKLYIELNDPATGTIIKLPGSVSADPNTGRLTATFKDNPQFPVEDIKLDFKTGPRAALTTPQTCGNYQTTSSLTPWSAPESGPPATPSDPWTISAGANNGACVSDPGQLPNKPRFEAGTVSPTAGAYSPFVLKLSREDGSQHLRSLDVTLPPGLTGKLAGVGECSDGAIGAAEGKSGTSEKASPSCPSSSELGTVNVGAGSGPSPFYVRGHAYLAGPYKGAPLSMAILTPAVAGPFDLGTVVVRAGLYVDPETAQITVRSDPIPQILAGIPLDIRSIAVNVSRNQFTLNPTSCDPKTLAATVLASASQASVSNPFQVGGCSALPYKPKLALTFKGGTRRTSHPRIIATLSAKAGEANTARVQVTLPKAGLLDNAHIKTICTRVQFAAETCPARAIYGHATASSPLLDYQVSGPVYLRSSNHTLPDLVPDLHGPAGQPIRVAPVIRTDSSKNGALRSTLEAAPDVPVSKFTLELFGGKRGLVIIGNGLCRHPTAQVDLTGQNGKAYDTQPAVKASCARKGGGKGHKHGKRS